MVWPQAGGREGVCIYVTCARKASRAHKRSRAGPQTALKHGQSRHCANRVMTPDMIYPATEHSRFREHAWNSKT